MSDGPIYHNGGLTRRRFLKLTFGATILAVAGFLLLDFKRTVVRILRADTRGLGVNDDAIETFMTDAARESFWDQFSFAKRLFIAFQHSLMYLNIRTPYYGKYLRYRNQITGQFLMSTDLFSSPGGKKDPIIYTGFHNPYKAPCSNPFSNLRS